MTSHRRIFIIFNPTSGRKRPKYFHQIIDALSRTGCTFTISETLERGHAKTLALQIDTCAYDVIAVAGGDGTINEVINGLQDISIPLAIIPLGTANVVAREIGQSFQPHKIAQTLAFGHARPITVGLANNHRFLMMAGAGFDANVVAGVSLFIKKHTGPLAYVIEAMRQALFGNLSMCEVSIDGKNHQAASVIVCNGSRYGGSFIAAPNASFASNEFQIILLRGSGFLSLFRYGIALFFNRLNLWNDVDIISGRDIYISGSKDQLIHTDGEIVRSLPIHIALEPELFRVIYPPEFTP